MATLTILGSGEAFDPNLPNSSLLYQGERTVLVDCGFSSVQSLWRTSTDLNFLDAVLLTHFHADHTFGLPALLMVIQAALYEDSNLRRDRPLTIIGPRGTRDYVYRLFDLAYTPGMARLSFPVEFIEAEPGETIAYDPFTIKTALPDHGIAVLSTRWEVDGQARFAYSADGKVTPATRALFNGVPTLVHECYAMPGKEGPVHSHIETVLQMAAECKVVTLVLVHQNAPQRTAIADFIRTQEVFNGQILMPEGVVRVGL